MKAQLSRRQFAGAGLAAASIARAAGVNDTIRLGMVGSGRRAAFLLRTAVQIPGVSLVAVSDLYEGNLKGGIDISGGAATPHREYRRLLDRTDIDAVIIATHNH